MVALSPLFLGVMLFVSVTVGAGAVFVSSGDEITGVVEAVMSFDMDAINAALDGIAELGTRVAVTFFATAVLTFSVSMAIYLALMARAFRPPGPPRPKKGESRRRR